MSVFVLLHASSNYLTIPVVGGGIEESVCLSLLSSHQ
jgi:hypothetical protein